MDVIQPTTSLGVVDSILHTMHVTCIIAFFAICDHSYSPRELWSSLLRSYLRSWPAGETCNRLRSTHPLELRQLFLWPVGINAMLTASSQ
ncbi:hypothetical protein EJ03DRAFT_211289 [Teratosphaeria nubilosa]|uniref:Uncharacterized protein n=1 Tax=Teratosphaeria nubilosa TaxID=161662 RepID=A0A6G1LGK0_9PEZI|nr:hypothetical protein EJ03DRAFT_211289 [Teratosphaeria nubilosa]